MSKHRVWQQNFRRILVGALLPTLACCLASRASGQQERQEAKQSQAEGAQEEQSLKQQLEAAEKQRQELEAELTRLRSQVEALKEQNAPGGSDRAAGQQGGTPARLSGLRRVTPSGRGPGAEGTHLKVFRLRYRDANEMVEIVQLFAQTQSGPDDPGGVSATGVPGSGQAARLRQTGGLAGRDAAGGGSAKLRVVADQRSGSIVVRATKEILAQVAKVVKTFDVPPGEVPVFEDPSQGAFTVRHADPEHVVQLLRGLGIDAMVAPNTKTLSVRGSESTLKEVGELIEALDVEGEE